ncbi:MAG: esterase-like activity of phytase family protein [Aquincola tertiaricarbonis]
MSRTPFHNDNPEEENMQYPRLALQPAALAAALMAALAGMPAQAANTLIGFAELAANTFAPGPTSGQFQSPASGVVPPYIDKQPVQGFSAVLAGPSAGSFYVMPDNGFGNKANSPDYLLRMYAVTPDFRTATGGSGLVRAADYTTGAVRNSFDNNSYINLRDPDGKLGFPIVAAGTNYPYAGSGAGNAGIPVDSSIRNGRLLTGGDLDIESVRRDKNGNLWFGEEFGPFLVKTDATGKVLKHEVSLPNSLGIGSNPLVQSPQNPYLGAGGNNLRGSNGFEGMAINPAGDKLYTLLEGPLIEDPNQKRLIINEFSVDTESYTGKTFGYRLDAAGTNIGDMTAINDHEFLVIERNGIQGTSPNAGDMFKKIFKIDLNKVDADGFAEKTLVVDLLDIADPNDLNRDGKTSFDFPFVTIEDVLILDANTLLVINDNNYPGNGGRTLVGPDSTEFIQIRLDTALNVSPVPEPGTYALMLAGLAGVGLVARRGRRAQAQR